ncbi:hypothetical protein L6164_015256 [Bauhinia variegata]|uniref:Uncharacterized protein n=1 Tax=Bauhinia variegata TaxID=167791 RepID=A0ACB9NK57_BAUVA|nr:hypothetical protein L6164_015256 [Bauhinia variegata]
MGAVCSAGMVEKNAQFGGTTLEFSGNLKKENILVNRKGDSSTNDRRKNRKKRDSGDIQSSTFSESTPTRTGERKVCFA